MKSTRKVMAFLLTFAMVFAMIPATAVSVYASDPGTTYSVSNEADLSSNLARMSDGDTLQLTTNIAISSCFEVNKSITLDLNGYVLQQTGTASVIKVTDGVTLTLADSNPNAEHTFTLDGGTGLYTWNEPADSPVFETLKGGCITGGKGENGGGITASGGAFTMQGGNIVGNQTTTTSGMGGGVYILNGAFNMTGGKIIGNVANNPSSEGGGVYVKNGTFNMTGGNIEANRASMDGGGVGLSHCESILNGGTINGNSVPGAGTFGGGVNVEYGTFTISAGAIKDNSAGAGGGVCVNSATFNMNGGSITGNTAVNNGGGVSGKINMTAGEIKGNSAKNGGGIHASAGTVIVGGTITGNTATEKGGGVYFQTGSPITFGGTAKVTGNVKDGTITAGVLTGGTPDNLYLDSKTITIGSGADAPKDGMSVGVTTSITPTEGTPKKFAENGTSDQIKYFFADNASCYVDYNTTSSYLQLSNLGTGKHKVSIESCENGTVYVDKQAAANNETVAIAVIPDSGYMLSENPYYSFDSTSASATYVSTNQYSLAMPPADVVISAKFEVAREPVFDPCLQFYGTDPSEAATTPTWGNSNNNYSFEGWYTQRTGGTRVESDFANGKTYYAHWKNTATGKLVATEPLLLSDDGLAAYYSDKLSPKPLTAAELDAMGIAITTGDSINITLNDFTSDISVQHGLGNLNGICMADGCTKPVNITLVGNKNRIGNIPLEENINAFNTQKGIHTNSDLTIDGSGSLTIYDSNEGIKCGNDFTVKETFTGKLTIVDYGKGSMACAIEASNNVKVLGGTLDLKELCFTRNKR